LNDSRLVSYTYDKMARPFTKLMSNGQESDYTYNSIIGRLSSVTHKLGDKIESLSYRYDLSGNKTEVVKHRLNETDNGTFTYGYDALNQLISVSKDNNLLREYTYDAFGNRASKKSYKDTIEESIYTYNKNNQLIKEVMPSVTKIYDYDKRGNLTTITSNDVVTDRYEYGINNQLISSSIVKNNDRVTSSYSYNGLGQRIGEVINTPEDPEKKISYVLDITKQYNNMLTESKGERIANYYYDNGAIALDIEDITSYYMQDDLGSILGLTDNECNIIESYDYDEFGNELELVSNPIQSLTYTGYRKEIATNSLYAQARQYNPRVGRFTSEDIIKGDRLMPISLNSYVYCYNKPEDYVDVDGRTASNLIWDSMVQGQKVKIQRAQSDIKMAGTDAGKMVYSTEAIILLALICPIGALGAFIGAVFSGFENSINEGSIEYFVNGYVGGTLDGVISGAAGLGTKTAVRFTGNAVGGTFGDLLTQKLNHPEENLKHSDYVNSSIKGLGQAGLSKAGAGVFKGVTGKSLDVYIDEMNFGQILYVDFILNKIKWFFDYSTKLVYDGTFSKIIDRLFSDSEDSNQCI